MKVTVLFFAKSREVANKPEEVYDLDDKATTATLLEKLLAQHPQLESVMKSCVFAVNQEYVQLKEAVQLKNGDEVAVIPPLSGG
eukprot:jgi/Chrzof1/3019/Cz12g08130.t1